MGKAVDEVRRREHQSLARKDDQSLKESLWLFRYNPKNLNPDQSAHLDELKRANLMAAKANQKHLNLQDIYKLNSVVYFQRKLSRGCDWVQSYGKSKDCLFKPMVAAAESILSHFDGIMSFAHSRITNAFMEGINSVFSAVKRKARGSRSNKNRIIMRYFVSGKLDIHGLQGFYLQH